MIYFKVTLVSKIKIDYIKFVPLRERAICRECLKKMAPILRKSCNERSIQVVAEPQEG